MTDPAGTNPMGTDPTDTDADLQLPQSLQALAHDLNAPGPALPLSDTDTERLIAGALRGSHRNRGALWLGNGVRKRRAMGAAALLLIGSSAAAAWYQHRIDVRDRENAQVAASGSDHAGQHRSEAKRPAPAAVPSGAVASNDAVQPELPPELSGPVADTPSRNVPAEDLLQKANRLRREGQPKEAEQTYLQLVQREPQSMSAYVARVAVAELRMGRNPTSAIELLQVALQHFPRGPLDIEIHQALAQGYRATGKLTLEGSELTQLTTQHPGTLAADRARARLSELGDK